MIHYGIEALYSPKEVELQLKHCAVGQRSWSFSQAKIIIMRRQRFLLCEYEEESTVFVRQNYADLPVDPGATTRNFFPLRVQSHALSGVDDFLIRNTSASPSTEVISVKYSPR